MESLQSIGCWESLPFPLTQNASVNTIATYSDVGQYFVRNCSIEAIVSCHSLSLTFLAVLPVLFVGPV